MCRASTNKMLWLPRLAAVAFSLGEQEYGEHLCKETTVTTLVSLPSHTIWSGVCCCSRLEWFIEAGDRLCNLAIWKTWHGSRRFCNPSFCITSSYGVHRPRSCRSFCGAGAKGHLAHVPTVGFFLILKRWKNQKKLPRKRKKRHGLHFWPLGKRSSKKYPSNSEIAPKRPPRISAIQGVGCWPLKSCTSSDNFPRLDDVDTMLEVTHASDY